MIRDEFKDLIEKRKETLGNDNLSQERREINKQIRESISSIDEGILAFDSIGDKKTLEYIDHMVSDFESVKYFIKHSESKKTESLEFVIKKLLNSGANNEEIKGELKNLIALYSEKSVLNEVLLYELPERLLSLLYDMMWDVEDAMILFKFYKKAPQKRDLEELIILKSDQYDLIKIIENSDYESDLLDKAIEKALLIYSDRELLLFLHKINSCVYDNAILVVEKLLEEWNGEDYYDFSYNPNFQNYIASDHIFINYIKFKQNIITRLANEGMNQAYLFLLLSGIRTKEELDYFKSIIDNNEVKTWAVLELKDFKSGWNSYEKSGKSVSDEFRKKDTSEIIEEYLNSSNFETKENCFWLLKWRVISGKDIKIDDHRLSQDHRFMSYFKELLDLGILEEGRLKEVFKQPMHNTIKSFKSTI